MKCSCQSSSGVLCMSPLVYFGDKTSSTTDAWISLRSSAAIRSRPMVDGRQPPITLRTASFFHALECRVFHLIYYSLILELVVIRSYRHQLHSLRSYGKFQFSDRKYQNWRTAIMSGFPVDFQRWPRSRHSTPPPFLPDLYYYVVVRTVRISSVQFRLSFVQPSYEIFML